MATVHMRTRTPVFIGANTNLGPFEYLVADGFFFRLRIEPIFMLILEKHPDAAESFEKWIEDCSSKIEQERDNQKLSKLRDAFTLPRFILDKLHDKALAGAVENGIRTDARFRRYAMRLESMLGLKKHGAREHEQRKKQLACALKTASDELYLPGSSIKGMLRTALAWQAIRNADDSLRGNIRRICQWSLQNERSEKSFAQRLETLLFSCKGDDRSDPQYDLLRFVHCGDSSTVAPEQGGVVAPVDAYLINGNVDPQTPSVECIDQNIDLTVELRVDVHAIRNIIKRGDGQQWKRLNEQCARHFGLQASIIAQAAPLDVEARAIDAMLGAIREHGRAILQHDADWLQRSSLSSMINLPQATPDAAAMTHIGYAGGFHSTTAYLAMLAHADLKDVASGILEKFHIGLPPRRARTHNPEPVKLDTFPTSRRLLTLPMRSGQSKGRKAIPLGWVEMYTEKPAPLPQTDEVRATNYSGVSGSILASAAKVTPVKRISLKAGDTDIGATVLRNDVKPIIVRLFAEGYEEIDIPCSGISNLASVPPGSEILVRVNEFDKKNKRVKSVTFLRNV